MSKMDAMRAMREARYEQEAARGTPRATPKSAARPVATAAAPEADASGPCGHLAISGRTCTREKGHTAKSHRYS